MILKGSRYEKALRFQGTGKKPSPFGGIRSRAIAKSTGVIEHTIRAGDRLDALARHYYNDDRLWWRIVDANPLFINGADMVWTAAAEILDIGLELENMVGRVILIPKAEEAP